MAALVAPRAYEVRFVHDAPRFGAFTPHFEIVLGNADLDVVDVHHHPRPPVVLDHPVPRPPAQSGLLSTLPAAAGPTGVSHEC
jgi:hypothetical protein